MKLTNKMYVVHTDQSYDYDQTSYVVGVYPTLEEAKKVFNDHVKDIKSTEEYDTVNEEETRFEAYNEGWYVRDHYLIEINVFDLKGEENA